jgi:hypothetical protein
VGRGMPFLPAGDDSGDPVMELRAQFEGRVARGRYDELLDEPMRAVIHQGSEIRGVQGEVGAIRFALAKALAEERDASRLANCVTQLTSALVRLVKLGQAISDETDESLADLLNRILIDLEKESQMARAARKEGGDDRTWRSGAALSSP